MATKAQIKKLAKAQGAQFFEGVDSSGDYYAEVLLPDHLIWDKGPWDSVGWCYQSKNPDETMAQFWEDMLGYIDFPVIKTSDLKS